MKIPFRYSNLLFGALLSAIMVSIVSAAVLLLNQGLTREFPVQWVKSVAATWPIAFPAVLVVAPWVRKVVARITESEQR
jgi:hypothetical protein